MAYRFKLNEPFGAGLRRIVLQQIDRAVAQLEPGAGVDQGDGAITAVHETRKCLKRARASLRLGRPALGDARFKAWNATLRDCGRQLASQRDRDVMMQLVLALRAENAIKPAAAARLQTSITTMPIPSVDRLQATIEAVRQLALLRSEVAACDLDQDPLDLTGMAICYQECRDTFLTAFDDIADEALHDWRKTVQLHWRHMQLLQAGWPAFFLARIEEARTISAYIGEDRDLGMLLAMSQNDRLPKLPAAVRRELAGVVAERRPALRQRARLRGERLLADGPGGLCRRIEVYWHVAGAIKS